MPGSAAKICLSEAQMEVLEEFAASRSVSVALSQRSRIILLGYQKKNNEQISEVVGLNPQQVGTWRKRWKAAWLEMVTVEGDLTCSELKERIIQLLSDRPGRGSKPKFTSEQQAAIVAIACEDPDGQAQRPVAQYSAREVADEAVKRGMVESISVTKVASFLKSGRSAAAPK